MKVGLDGMFFFFTMIFVSVRQKQFVGPFRLFIINQRK